MLSGERKSMCPHCGRPFGGIRYGYTFGFIATRIIDTVSRAGPDGIEPDLLFQAVYCDGERPAPQRAALKAYINWINDKLRPEVSISGRGGVYRLLKQRRAA